MAQLFFYIPKNLDVKGEEHLNIFPYNILICSYQRTKDDKLLEGLVMYLPDTDTYCKTKTYESMIYPNYYCKGYFFKIFYFKKTKSYRGIKYANNKIVGEADGNNWRIFFIHVGLIGISNGEKCELKIREGL